MLPTDPRRIGVSGTKRLTFVILMVIAHGRAFFARADRGALMTVPQPTHCHSSFLRMTRCGVQL